MPQTLETAGKDADRLPPTFSMIAISHRSDMKRRLRSQSRKLRRGKRQKNNTLSFQRLEPRQLLAGDFVGGHQIETQLPAGQNLVVNGDFETVTPGADNFYETGEVNGWVAAEGADINIWNYDATYGNVVDLDSTVADFDRVFQDVQTESLTEYIVAFDYRNHPTIDPSATPFTHDFEVWWGGELVGRFTGGDNWHTSVIKVTSTEFDSSRLLFCEIQEPGAPGGDGRGALLDNIRVFKADSMDFVNGGFETTPEGQSTLFNSDDVDGWSAFPDQSGANIMQIDVDGDNQYLNLDSSLSQRDIVYRRLETTPGATYYLTFDARFDGDQSLSSDQLRIRWNDSWAGTIIGTADWETYGLVLTATDAESLLMFLEPGENLGEGSGPLIDNVQMYTIPQPSLQVDLNGDDSGVDGATVFIPGAGAQAVAQDIALTNSNSELSSATVTLDGVVDGSREIIAIVNSTIPQDSSGNPKINVLNYDPATRQLILTGQATVQEYQNVLRTLSYFNTAEEMGTTDRTITVSVTDASLPPNEGTAQATLTMTIETDQANIDDAILMKYIVDNGLVAEEIEPGLYAVIDVPGSGQNPTINSSVRVAYEGRFVELNESNRMVDGAVFDASSEAGIVFPLTGVIQGWQRGIPAFKTGGQGMLLIASRLAYGDRPNGGIPANSVLIFDVNLIEIVS